MNNLIIHVGLIGCLLACTGRFYLAFHSPKILLFLTTGSASCLYLLFKRDIQLPKKNISIFLISLLVLGTTSVLISEAKFNVLVSFSTILCAVSLFIALINFPDSFFQQFLKSLYFISIFEALLALAQTARIKLLPDVLITSETPNSIGTLGNPEFVATLLGVGFLIGLMSFKEISEPKWKAIHFISQLIIFLGIAATRSKGTLLLLVFLFIWVKTRHKRNLIFLSIASGVLFVLFFPDSIYGRCLLWLSSLITIKNNLLFGAGWGQIGNHYLDGVHELFIRSPMLQQSLGNRTAAIVDAHNIILNFGVELGILGLFLAGLFVVYGFKEGLRQKNIFGLILLFLILKSLYTVIHTSITSLLLLTFVLAAVEKSKPAKTISKGSRLTKGFSVAYVPLFLFSCYVSSADYNYKKGMNNIAEAKLTEAKNDLSLALKKNPNNGEVYLAIGHVYFLEKDFDRMNENMKKALHYQKDRNILRIAAHMYYYSGIQNEAFKLYSYLNTVYPQHLTSLTKLAQIQLKRKNYQEAHRLASKVIDSDPRLESDTDFKNRLIAGQIINETGPLLFGGK